MKAALLDSFVPPLMLVIIMYVLSESPEKVCPEKDWVILTDHHICAVRGSSVVMPCSLTPSAGKKATNVFWLINAKEGKDPPDIADNPSYHGRVKYYWKKKNNNKNRCTLKLTDVKFIDRASYWARIIAGKDKWQSCSSVQLSVTGLTVSIPTPVMKGRQVKLSCNNDWMANPQWYGERMEKSYLVNQQTTMSFSSRESVLKMREVIPVL
ncbi:uncharacterized protein LOC121719612 [Alosa sapidissima]|uniref:uncharacterized protein LOC121719612 n=1 Tax=Alosa sapidissima TaxID=34773 RepID=UPI001C091CBF|nr:uncharacterized protein LOC121719612 [Alosa sapidissima]XP_041961331.1 uncharacterized protein LOC121719612 [Alosa sapidissima]XP_041961332.1 uncharacterized protein LOC121719612 [Alosa sapidissima]XP_041961333.1 uncharacterized protein LOC121719612 [Alosa sapidissima]XP_041961334.1 uncharacterized protein LOC121719612 [Alosa sapidissima]